MSIPDYTLVCGVDKKHLEQLELVWPTWKKNKKDSITSHPMLVFFDREQLTAGQVKRAIDHPDMIATAWPPEGIYFEGNPDDKWTNPQRAKMLSGFIYVAAALVQTPYWLKLDTDVVATGQPDWIDPGWFDDDPAIVSHAWAFTKPPDQMMVLDEWVNRFSSEPLISNRPLQILAEYPPLNLEPKPGADRLGHKRIISWCSFWETQFTCCCSDWASSTCGPYKLPVPSQDGYLWYCAKRTQDAIIRTSMKKRGWAQWLTMRNIRKSVEEAMGV